MGELILCHHSIAANPYYIDELSLNVYSLEELSYYIFRNVYLLNDAFMSVDLCRWIGSETGEKDLEKQLLDLLSENAPLHIFVSNILTSCGYLTNKEIKDTLEIIKSFENKSDAECQKLRGDRLMEKMKIVDAIYEYENLLETSENLTEQLKGDVYHNLGTAYAKLFFYKEAAECYEKAYQAGHKRVSLRSMLFCRLLGEDEENFHKAVSRYMIPEDVAKSLMKETGDALGNPQANKFDDYIDHLRADYSDQDAYLAQISSIMDQWKQDYNRLCRI